MRKVYEYVRDTEVCDHTTDLFVGIIMLGFVAYWTIEMSFILLPF